MPIYEYYCFDCRRRVSLFYRTISAAAEQSPSCPHCHGIHLRRLVSRVAVLRSEDAHLDALTDLSVLAGLEQEDPRALGRFMKQMSNELGEEMDDPELGEVIERLASGQSPEEIEQSMPDLLGDSIGAGGAG